MNRQKLSAHTLMCLLACATAACSNDLDQKEIPTQGEGERITMTATANMPQDQPSTRVVLNETDTHLEITWRQPDGSKDSETLSVLPGTDPTTPSTFTLESVASGDAHKGSFTGEITPVDGATYYAIYPALSTDDPVSATVIPLDMTGQKGTLDENKIYMYGSSEAGSNRTMDFNFQHLTSIVKVTMNFPAEVGTNLPPHMDIEPLTRALSGAAMTDVTFSATSGLYTNAEADITQTSASYSKQTDGSISLTGPFTLSAATNPSATVYLHVLPGTLTDFKVMATVDGKSYIGTVSASATITAGKMYTKTVEMTQVATMKFTVKVENDDLGFNIPFPTNSSTTPATITVDWGDGNTSTVASGTALSESDEFNHTYLAAGEYTITIISDQTDATLKQIPRINFGNYRADNRNQLKLISVDTPLLNMKETSLQLIFCGCESLASIPKGLFANNTETTDFSGSFYNCPSLQSIPEGLFANNKEATNFKSCFSLCFNLTLNKKIFTMDEPPYNRFAGKEMDFESCFESAGTRAAGTAPDLWNYNKGGATWTTTHCFDGANTYISNWGDIPTDWGGSKSTN